MFSISTLKAGFAFLKGQGPVKNMILVANLSGWTATFN
jgi:hypothetical protein